MASNFDERIKKFKKFVINETLKQVGGNRRAAADLLGCHRNTVSKLADHAPNPNKIRPRKQDQIAKDQLYGMGG